MKIFSFCLYGDSPKYCLGLYKNLLLIQQWFPDFETWIYHSSNVKSLYLDLYKTFKIKLIPLDIHNAILMVNRFYPIDNPEVEIMFVRDADSRINERDRWCIEKFMESESKFHIIRDNFMHRKLIMGGMWGIKKGILKEKIEDMYEKFCQITDHLDNYSKDQDFLESYIYPKISHNSLIHSPFISFLNESVTFIDFDYDGFNFVGNCINNNDIPEFNGIEIMKKYITTHIEWCISQNSYDMIINTMNVIKLDSSEWEILWKKYYNPSHNLIYMKTFGKIQNITEQFLLNSNLFITSFKHIIATFDPLREPKDDEFVIVYGNYLLNNSLPSKNKIYRSPIYYNTLKHNINEFETFELPIDNIYIIGKNESLLLQLCEMKYPLNCIKFYKSNTDNILMKQKIHLEILKQISSKNYCIIFDTFSKLKPLFKQNLSLLFSSHSFTLCSLSPLTFPITKIDNLTSFVNNNYVTSEVYIINSRNVKELNNIEQDYKIMLKSGKIPINPPRENPNFLIMNNPIIDI